MKKSSIYLVFALLAVVLLGTNVKAQTNTEEIDLYQSIFGMEKKALVADFVKLENDNPFWAVYDAYETERKALGKERIDALYKYVEEFEKMDDAKYDEVVETFQSFRKSTDKLIDTYYKKVKKASGSKVAGQFYQLESYFVSAIRINILEEIPYIGEFDDK